VRRIWPTPDDAELDPLTAVAAEERHADGRPWLLLNMVTALDGRVTDREGRAEGVSGPADRDLFRAIRALADVVLVGAGTARAENYGPARLPDEAVAMRRDRGQPPLPRVAVVTRSLRFDPEARLFQVDDPDLRPVVITTEGALSYAPEIAEKVAERAELRVAGEHTVEWPRALQVLHDDLGARIVLGEGGPTINAQLFAAGVVDEMCLTLAPRIMGDDGPTLLSPEAPFGPLDFALTRVYEHDAYLFLRYER
jgi:riboflavin-specific deaminase-like protein